MVGLPPAGRTRFDAHNTLRYPPVDPELHAELYEYYRPYNAHLYELIGEDYGWERLASQYT